MDGERVTIGRGEEVEARIQFTAVSREHAVILRKDGGFFVEDLGSANGTRLNDEEVQGQAELKDGDKIGLGRGVILRFEAPEPEGATAVSDEGVADGAEKVEGTMAAEPSGLEATAVSTPKPSQESEKAAEGASEVKQDELAGTRIAGSVARKKLAATTIGEAPMDPTAADESPTLVVKIAGELAHRYTLSADEITVGREASNDLTIESPIVSRHHLTLFRSGAGYRVEVSSSASNPLMMDGRPVAGSQDLADGVVLRIGGRDPGSLVTMEYTSPAEAAVAGPQAITFADQTEVQIGRDPENDVVVDAPMVSRFHASIERVGKRFRLRDLNSSNGTFVNGEQVEGETWLAKDDTVRVGPYRFVLGVDTLAQYDDSSEIRVEVRGLNKWVRKDLNILEDISMVLQPREFVVVVGQSGGGKSTLVDAIAGYRPATHGQVLVNGVDVYQNFDAIRNIIGYVPQKDIIHNELTVFEALDYAAQLRMPSDTSKEERHARIHEVLEELDIAHRADVQISGLSGGQQKRVSIGVELLTKPGLFFLDEPSSGLDPGTETALMQLMRRLADQGRTITLITHATKNVLLADKVVFLARGGHMAWFGPPDEALDYFNHYRSERERQLRPMEFDDIYALLADSSKGMPEDWAARYEQHPAYQENVVQPLAETESEVSLAAAAKQVVQPIVQTARNQVSALRQFLILSSRNIRILTRDRFSLGLMLAAAPLVGLLDVVLSFVLGRQPFDFTNGDMPDVLVTLFLLSVYGVMVGGLSQMREIVKEQEIYRRERLVNLKVLPYVLSKFWVAALFALYQSAAYVIIHYLAFDMPGGAVEFLLIYVTMTLTTMVGMMIGLFASALAPTANAAPMLVILFMLPQIVLGGALVPLPRAVSAVTTTSWAFAGFMGITGPGSDIAADVCFQLPDEQRFALTMEGKVESGCRCIGPNALYQENCNFPGAGQFYRESLDQPPPAEPGEPPPRPEDPNLPEPPVEPEDQSDAVAVADYLEALEAYQAEVDEIQRQSEQDFANYEAQLEVYQAEVASYQQERVEWQISREAAVQPVESLINKTDRDFGWALVNKEDPVAYTLFLLKSWGAQVFMIGALLAGILVLQKRKDVI